ncbi:280_t:CDS:2, partial [Racocetra fulgida]
MLVARQHNNKKRSRTIYYEHIQKARILSNENAEYLADQTKDETSIRIYKKFAIVSMSVDFVTPPLIDDKQSFQNLVMQRSLAKQRKSTPNRKNYGKRTPRSKNYVYNEPKRSNKAVPL